MVEKRLKFARGCYAVVALLGTFAVVSQFAMVLLGTDGTAEDVARKAMYLLSFLTILTNIALTLSAARLAWRLDGIFARPRVATALAVYATVVFAIYELALRHLWHPQGLALVSDTLLHDVMPIATVILWWICIAKGKLSWRDASFWLIPPAIYGICIGVRGYFTGESPYPFLNVTAIGGGRVAVNLLGLLLIFWLVGIVYIWLDRRLAQRRRKVLSGTPL